MFFTDLGIAQQLLPFVRWDGYWALADLTGIPDFFSLMGPFVRSIVPLRRWKGTQLPDLKGWVKVIFGIYTLVTVPLLSVLWLLMAKSLPVALPAIWIALDHQVTLWFAAQRG